MDYVAPKTNYNVNQIGHFKQLVVGAGSKVFKANDSGVFAGATSYGTAPFKLSYAGALVATGANITGTINATGGTISGDLTVTGSLLSDDGATFQTQLKLGVLNFLKDGVVKGIVKTASGSNGLTLASVSTIYFTGINGEPNAELDANSNLKFSNNAYISWAGGRKITADGANLTLDGGCLILGSVRATGFVARVGETDYSGQDESFAVVTNTRMDGTTLQHKKITMSFTKGLLTNLSDESDWENA